MPIDFEKFLKDTDPSIFKQARNESVSDAFPDVMASTAPAIWYVLVTHLREDNSDARLNATLNAGFMAMAQLCAIMKPTNRTDEEHIAAVVNVVEDMLRQAIERAPALQDEIPTVTDTIGMRQILKLANEKNVEVIEGLMELVKQLSKK